MSKRLKLKIGITVLSLCGLGRGAQDVGGLGRGGDPGSAADEEQDEEEETHRAGGTHRAVLFFVLFSSLL